MISAQVSCFAVFAYKARVTVPYSPGDFGEQISTELWGCLDKEITGQGGQW